MGRVVGAFGVQGWIKVKPFTEAPDGLGAFPTWWLQRDGHWHEMAVEAFEVHSKGPVAQFAGCADREAAERLRGAEIGIPRAALGEAAEGTLYWVDLVGLEVVDEEGHALGTVDGLFETGPTSVLVVKGGRERMIPFVDDYVKSVDRAARRIVVRWKADYDA